MNFLEYWYSAANSEHGICLETTNPASVKQQLYQARKNADDSELTNFSIVPSPINPNHLWITRARKPGPKVSTNVVELKI